jgi:DNA-binding transcriptional regulator YiaG
MRKRGKVMEDAKKLTVEEKLIQGLESFADSVENDEDIGERFTCHKIVLDLQPSPYNPELVKATRKALRVSQRLFAQFLGVSTKCVQSWEQGETTPQSMACRFMDEIRHDPERWRNRFKEFIVPKATR